MIFSIGWSLSWRASSARLPPHPVPRRRISANPYLRFVGTRALCAADASRIFPDNLRVVAAGLAGAAAIAGVVVVGFLGRPTFNNMLGRDGLHISAAVGPRHGACPI